MSSPRKRGPSTRRPSDRHYELQDSILEYWVPAFAGTTPRESTRRKLLRLQRSAHARGCLGRGVRHLLDQCGDLLAGERIYIELELLGVGQKFFVFHGGV